MLADPFLAHVDVAGGAPTTEGYALLSVSGGNTVRVRNVDPTAGYPKTLKISHQKVGKGSKARMRHLVRLEGYQVTDGVEDLSVPYAVYTVLDVPESGISETQLQAIWKRFVGLLRGASGDAANEGDETQFFHKWHRGEG